MNDKKENAVDLKVIELPKSPKFWYWYGCSCDPKALIAILPDLSQRVICNLCKNDMKVIAHVSSTHMELIKLAAKCFK